MQYFVQLGWEVLRAATSKIYNIEKKPMFRELKFPQHSADLKDVIQLQSILAVSLYHAI